MRILPIALINLEDSSRRYLDIWRNTIITHGHPRGLMGAILLADSIRLLINNPPTKFDWLDKIIEICSENYPELIEIWIKDKIFLNWERQWNEVARQNFQVAWHDICHKTLEELKLIRNDFNSVPLEKSLVKLGCYRRETKGAGDTTVIAAILFICRLTNFNYDIIGNPFEEVITSIANQIGIDTDTIAYFAGAMIGAQYGIKAIPDSFKQEIQDCDYLLQVADWCHQVYLKNENINKAFTYSESNNARELKSFAFFLDKDFTKNQPINIPVFGKAKILNDIDITPDGLGKHLHWLHIKLEFGQTIFLKIERSNSVSGVDAQISSIREQYVVSSLAVLDEYKKRVESSNFDSDVIVSILKEIKYEKRNRAIYNALATWLWTALPSNIKSEHT